MKYVLAFMLLVLAAILTERCAKGFAYAIKHKDMWGGLGYAILFLAIGPMVIVLLVAVALIIMFAT